MKIPDKHRLDHESSYWDSAAAQHTALHEDLSITPDPSDLRRHDLLSGAAGRVILDAGGGTGTWTETLTAAGAAVVCGDISFLSIRNASQKCVGPLYCRMDVLHIPLTSQSVDAVHGQDILHHVDPDRFGSEVSRILKTGGVAVFWENSGANPALMAARNILCGRFGIPKWSSPDEHPLTKRERLLFMSHFKEAAVEYPEFLFFHYFDAKFFGFKNSFVTHFCKLIDGIILKYFPCMHGLSYRQLIVCKK